MTDDLVKRLREVKDWWREPGRTAEQAADRIEALQDIIAKIQYTNLRQDINAESRTIEIDRMCKEKIK